MFLHKVFAKILLSGDKEKRHEGDLNFRLSLPVSVLAGVSFRCAGPELLY